MTPADQLRRRAELGIDPVQPIDPGPLTPIQRRNERAHAQWSERWYLAQLAQRLRRLARSLRGLPADG